MPSQDEVAGFQAIIGRLAAIAGETAATIAREITDTDELADVYPAAVDPYLSASSLITAEWYDSLSDAPFAVEPVTPPLETVRYKADWAVGEPDPAAALADATDRLVFNASRDTVIDNAEREEIRYARYAQQDACAWCSILAMRGLIYHSRESAARSHDLCKCVVVPERDGDYYLEPDWVDGWRTEYEAAAKEVGTKRGLDPIVNSMRRRRHAEDPEKERAYQREYYDINKEQINTQARKRRANKKTLAD